jgi:lipoprotein-anchoring transpeptidase ErfK/SrfK
MVACIVVLAISGGTLFWLATNTRHQREVTRAVYTENVLLLDEMRRTAGATDDSLEAAVSAPIDSVGNRPFIVISIADHRLWYRQRDQVIFTTRVATGSGKVLATGGSKKWKFETPRGRLVVLNKESDPTWTPPDWHYVEVAHKKKARVQQLTRTAGIPLKDSSVIAVNGTEVVRRYPDGHEVALEGGEGRELVLDGKVIVPPFGTNQRRFAGVVGTHRLNLGDGYGLHGTDVPSSIGTSVSHGCVRLRNEDIETLYRMVPIGTPVYIY